MKYLIPILLLSLCTVCQAEEKEYPGAKTLDDAMVAKLLAEKLSEVENVAKLAYRAIDEGLSESDEQLARKLIQTAYLERAVTLTEGLRNGHAETQREINMFVTVGLDDLKHVVEAAKSGDKDNTESNIDYADVYWYVKASLLSYTDDEQAYQEALTKAQELNKNNDKRMANLAVIDIQREENASKRLKKLQKALDAYPESEGIRKALIDTYIQLEKPEEAVKFIEELKQNSTVDSEYLLILSDYHFNHGEYETAMEELEQLERLDPKNTEVLTQEALCALFLGDVERFMSCSQKALKQNPNNILLHLLRAEEFIGRKKFEAATAELDTAMFFDNQVVSLKVLKVYVEYKLDRYTKEKLLEALEKLAKDSELVSEDLRYFCIVFQDLKNSQAFLKFLNFAIEHFPDNHYIQESLTQAYMYDGQIDKAKETFEKYLKINPDNYTLLNNYSWLLSTCPDEAQRDGEKALELGLRAAQLTNGKEAFVLSTLAAAYAETGDFDKAIETVQKGISICKDPEMKQAMTKELDSYKQKKPFREAIETWKD